MLRPVPSVSVSLKVKELEQRQDDIISQARPSPTATGQEVKGLNSWLPPWRLLCVPHAAQPQARSQKVEERKLGLKTREVLAQLEHPGGFFSCSACCLIFPFSDSLRTIFHSVDFQKVGWQGEGGKKKTYMVISNT